MPLCFGASGSVRTKVRMTSAWWAPEVHTFWPLTTKWSPSSTARVRRPARSLPAPGSLMPSAAVDLAAEDRHGPAFLLLVGAEVEDRRRDDAEALRVEAGVDPAAGQLLEVHELLDQRGVAAAVLGRLAGTSQPASNSVRCHRRAHSGRSAVEPGRSAVSASVGRVGVEPLGELAAEGLGRVVEGELHGQASPVGAGGSSSRAADPRPVLGGCRRAAARRPWPAGGRGAGRSPR